jgi:surface polysaccharide O-acyltransferase-like enzyme
MRENLVKENLVKKERVEWIDLLRFLAITFVIIIHSCGAYVTSTKGTEVWWIFNIVNSFSHFSVPIFVMISGALLLKRDEPINIF